MFGLPAPVPGEKMPVGASQAAGAVDVEVGHFVGIGELHGAAPVVPRMIERARSRAPGDVSGMTTTVPRSWRGDSEEFAVAFAQEPLVVLQHKRVLVR